MPDLTPEQQAIFDAEIESLRERLDWRKAIMALPSLKQRAAALKSLRVAVSSVRRASRSKALQTAGLFSYQTEQWLDDAQAVADELRELTKPLRNPVLARTLLLGRLGKSKGPRLRPNIGMRFEVPLDTSAWRRALAFRSRRPRPPRFLLAVLN